MACREGSFSIDGPVIHKRPNPQFLSLSVVLVLQLTNRCHGNDDRRGAPPPPPPQVRRRGVDQWSQSPLQEDPNSYNSNGIGLDQPYGGSQTGQSVTSRASWYTDESRLDLKDNLYDQNKDPSADHAAGADWYNIEDAAESQPYANRDRYNYFNYDRDNKQQHLPSHPKVKNAAASGSVVSVSDDRPRITGPQMPIHFEFPLSREAAKDQEKIQNGDENDEDAYLPASASARRDLVTRYWSTKTGKAQIMMSSTLIGVTVGNFLGKVRERETG
jgi:hypothetical protein